MMSDIREETPRSNEELREALYGGALFLLEPTDGSLRLVEAARAEVCDVFKEFADPRQAQHQLDDGQFFRRVGELRRRLFTQESFHRAIGELVREKGFDPAQVAFDPIRIRAIAHEGHKNEAAAPVYYAHRDTWYGHPQSLITWWIPLDDLEEEETFVFYPERFAREVPNDSEIFDYRDWVRDGPELRIGWQDEDASKEETYPGVIGEVEPGREVGFRCKSGQSLLFSGSHFHRTREQESGRTRFSMDFRIVHLGDEEAGLGAPNVDNRSRGSALVDYERIDD